MVEVKRFSNWNEAYGYRDAWNELISSSAVSSVGIPSIFQTYEWNHAWWTAFGKGNELLLLGAFEGANLIGVAPFMITRRWLPLPSRAVRFIGGANFASDYCSFIFAPGKETVVALFAQWISDHPELWNELDFANVLADSPGLVELTRRFGDSRFKPELRFLYDAPTRLLGDEVEDREIVNKKSLKRHFNWFKNQGELVFRHWENADEIECQLDEFFNQHISRRSVTDARSPFRDSRQRLFYRVLVDMLLPKGWLRFSSVTLNGEAIAYHFGFEYGERYYWYKPSFSIKYIKKSPGEVLLKSLMEYSMERKLKEFDFTVGSEAFKYRFSNRIRKAYRFHAFRTLPPYLAHKTIVFLGMLRRATHRLARLSGKGPVTPPRNQEKEDRQA